MIPRIRHRIVIIAPLLFIAASFPAAAQDGSAADIAARLERVKADTTLDDASRTALLDVYNQALPDAQAWDGFAAKSADYEKLQKDAPANYKQLQDELSKPAVEAAPDIKKDMSAAEMDLRLAQEQMDLAAARKAQQDIEAEQQQRTDRRKALPDAMAAAKAKLAALPTPDSLAALPSEAPELFEARRIAAAAKLGAAQAELDALSKELLSYEAGGRLLSLRLDLAARETSRHERIVKTWQDALEARRRAEAQEAANDAQKKLLEAAATSTAARALAENLAAENLALVQERTGANGLLMKIQTATQDTESVEAELKRVETELDGVRKKVAAAGFDEVAGRVLRRQRELLPNLRDLTENLDRREKEIASLQLKLIDYRQERAQLADIGAVADACLQQVNRTDPNGDKAALKKLFSQLLTAKRDSLQAMIDDLGGYTNQLAALQAKETELAGRTSEFSDFINENVLWIRSGALPGMADARAARDALRWFASPVEWRHFLSDMKFDLNRYPLDYAGVVLGVFAAVLLRWRLKRTLKSLGEQAQNRLCRSMRPTIDALLICIVLSAPISLLLIFAEWRIYDAGSDGLLAVALSRGCFAAGCILYSVLFPIWCLRSGSLAQCHLGWHSHAIQKMRRHLNWFAPALTLLAFCIGAAVNAGNDLWTETLGRALYVAALCVAAAFLHAIANRDTGPVWDILFPDASGRGIRWVYFPLQGVNLLLAAGAVYGYFYTAMRLSIRLHATVCFACAVFLGYHIALHWLLLAKRRLAMEQARRRREAQKAESSEALMQHEESAIDIARVDEQTRRLMRGMAIIAIGVSVWFLWSQEIPALGVLNRVTLWENTTLVTETKTGADGQTATVEHEVAKPVTLGNLALAAVIALVSLAFVRNLPGFVDILLHRRMHLMAGERNAVTTIVRYTLILLGGVLTFNAIGVGWEKVQWLAAALSLGLGFGLQEIFANFVSGLILLFERPIRVGDTVTIGGISGQVTRIRIRATTIMDWDRKELIVPNKEFVTGQLVNWTLSDATIRIVVPVGVAYNADIERAEELLRRAAAETPNVLEEPAPVVLFKEFGDSALGFEVRVYSPDLDHYLGIQHRLHANILRAFRDAGIEIAFPQRDVHVDFPKGIPVVVTPGKAVDEVDEIDKIDGSAR